VLLTPHPTLEKQKSGKHSMYACWFPTNQHVEHDAGYATANQAQQAFITASMDYQFQIY
jgi:hypothetical protein